MNEKIYTQPNSANHSDDPSEPHHIMQQILLEENFSNELALLQSLKMMPRPEAVEDLLYKINLKMLEEHL